MSKEMQLRDGLLLTGTALLWALLPALLHTAPPLDVVELVSLADTGAIANYKHPNLPGLILDGLRFLGLGINSLYAVSQLCVLATVLIIYRLAREFVSGDQALVSAALLFGIYYFTLPTPEFNHNVLQMPMWAGVIALAWFCVAQNKSWQWLVLGVLAGLVLWVKYSAGILLLSVGLWFLLDPSARRTLATPGPWIVLVVSSALAAPQLAYLTQTDFLPLQYASARAAKADDGPVVFLLTQLANHLPMLIVAGIAGVFGVGAWRTVKWSRSTRFIVMMFALPLALICVVGFNGLRSMWGAPMFSLSGLVLVYFFGGRLDGDRCRRVVTGSVMCSALLLGLYSAQLLIRDLHKEKPSRVLWPQQEIASAIAMELGRVPETIVGPYWEAGLVAMQPDGWRRVLIDGDARKSPWAQDLSEGYALVWRGSPGPQLAEFMTNRGLSLDKARQVSIPWSHRQPPIVLNLLSPSAVP